MEWADPNVRSASATGVSPDKVRRPSDMSATIRLEVYASFEFQPTLGAAQQLRKFTTTVEQLSDWSAKDVREWNIIFAQWSG